MPTPSASCTAADLSTRPMLPRAQTTIVPATRAASRLPGAQTRACDRLWPGAATSPPRTTRAGPTPRVEAIAPVSDPWLPSRTSPRRAAPVVLPTVVTQGLACAANARFPALRGGDHDHVGLGGSEQGPLHGVEAGRAAHAEVEDVDAVAGGLVDRGHEVGGRAAVAGSGAIQHAL